MSIAWNIFIFLHILGAVAVVGGWFASFKKPTILPIQLVGSIAQVITGVVLMGLTGASHFSMNYTPIIVKLIIGLIVMVCAIVGYAGARKGKPVPTGLAHAVGGLGLINIAIATLWH